MSKLDPFTAAYIDAALWSSTAYGSPDEDADDPVDADGNRRGTFDRSFQECNYDRDDLSTELLAHVVADCRDFQESNAAVLRRAYLSRDESYTDAQAGHDFWLTRNGHGAGFWDRGLGPLGRQLADAAHVYGGESWYVVRDVADPDDYGKIAGMVSLRVMGTNGAEYYGRGSWDWGQCVTLRRCR